MNSSNAVSTEEMWESVVRSRLWNFRAQISTKCGKRAKPSDEGSRIERKSGSSRGVGGMSRALAGG
jgi:hypothetical protein